MSIPLSLYIHTPWCIRKCPYCDFNSHAKHGDLPEQAYVAALIDDLKQDLPLVAGRTIDTIFIGGGTPSLFSAASFANLIEETRQLMSVSNHCEITMEANPGSFEQQKFQQFRQAGINRLSLGIQSFDATMLQRLGRIHDDKQALIAAQSARQAGFNNFNLDLMFGLPQQTLQQALDDLQTAIDLKPPHLSWYQLTLEPNTVFYSKPPRLPLDDELWDMQQQGQQLLAQSGYQHYEVSAYAQPQRQCRHNLNYWQFGDYLGIGAGAHSKVTLANGDIIRMAKQRLPASYLDPSKSFIADRKNIPPSQRPFEYMLNLLRLQRPIDLTSFETYTGLNIESIMPMLQKGMDKELLHLNDKQLSVTPLGQRFLNDVMALFLEQ